MRVIADSTDDITASVRVTDSMEPKRNALRSVFTPPSETAMTPIASAEEEMSAMALSPPVFRSDILSRRKAAATTTGMVTAIGDMDSTAAMPSAPNPTGKGRMTHEGI